MTQAEIDQALDELDRLLNDPEVRMDPDRVWSILAEVSPLVAGTSVPAAAVVSRAASPRSGTPGSPRGL